MQEAVINFCRVSFAPYLLTGQPMPRTGSLGASSRIASRAASSPARAAARTTGATSTRRRRRDLGATAGVMGREELIDDPRFATPEARIEHRDEVDEIVVGVDAPADKREVMECSGPRGVPAGAVLDAADLSTDPALRERGMFVELEHPVRGKFVMPGWPVKMSGSSVPVEAAPLLGQHNEEVLGELLGYSAEQVAALREERVL